VFQFVGISRWNIVSNSLDLATVKYNTYVHPKDEKIKGTLRTRPNNLIQWENIYMCRIWGSHNGSYEELYLLGYGLCLLPASLWCLAWLILRTWRWRRQIPPKRRLTCNGLHGIISQKIELLRKYIVEITVEIMFRSQKYPTSFITVGTGFTELTKFI
jgi:hypothetical protein